MEVTRCYTGTDEFRIDFHTDKDQRGYSFDTELFELIRASADAGVKPNETPTAASNSLAWKNMTCIETTMVGGSAPATI